MADYTKMDGGDPPFSCSACIALVMRMLMKMMVMMMMMMMRMRRSRRAFQFLEYQCREGTFDKQTAVSARLLQFMTEATSRQKDSGLFGLRLLSMTNRLEID